MSPILSHQGLLTIPLAIHFLPVSWNYSSPLCSFFSSPRLTYFLALHKFTCNCVCIFQLMPLSFGSSAELLPMPETASHVPSASLTSLL